ncbi:MAG: methyl-accepting chemotaxis protein [Lachnospiraceae bacterium]|nr:methyl-accepting chemotaxis protein [Lachnospiraceae bacterium]
MNENNRVSFFHSIKIKILLLVFGTVFSSVVICIATAVPLSRSSVTNLTENYMEDIAYIAGTSLERDVEAKGYENVMTAEVLESYLGGVKVKGMDSSYAYLVSSDSTMMYHPTPDKIGQPVENAAVKQLVGEIAQGNRPETDVIIYDFKGVTKYASFYIDYDKSFILVVTADENEILKSVTSLTINSIIGGLIVLFLCNIVGFIVALKLVKPIERTTREASRLAELDFTRAEAGKGLLHRERKDETGVMNRAISILQQELALMAVNVNEQCGKLHDSAGSMAQSVSKTLETVEQVEKAVNEIAQGATNQAQETQTATEEIIAMGNMIEETEGEVEELRENARKMRSAGEQAMEILSALGEVNQQTKDAIAVIAKQTDVTNESAMKIKTAVDIITDIAEETNLLSLNASIEAARAGEQGKGFAVVAGQIQKLAEQSNESAQQITGIIELLIQETQRSVQTMSDVKVVIEKQDENVTLTEKAFEDVKDGIAQSIEGIRAIARRTKELDETRVKVVDVVQSLTAIAEENAASTEETSASATEMGAIMESIDDNARSLSVVADQLHETISKFKV